ncbi:MAG: signal recognition particle-docking protein FtsY [Candidatus Thorarchaeota archaeon]
MFDRLRQAIDTTLTKITTRELNENNLSDAIWELQLVLVQNDVAVEVAEHVCNATMQRILGSRAGRLERTSRIFREAVYQSVLEVLSVKPDLDPLAVVADRHARRETTVIMFVGVNGTGKTTTLAKIANLCKTAGYSVVIAASDTYRAGSIEQLEKHAQNLKVEIIKQHYGADAAAVAYDTIAHARARRIDVVLIDTAGRMQSNKNLLAEMQKIARVSQPNIKIFVGDSLAGNDAVSQAREFNQAIEIDGTILTKIDADPSGGAALSIAFVTGKPIMYVCTGQGYDDIERFSPERFASRIVPV